MGCSGELAGEPRLRGALSGIRSNSRGGIDWLAWKRVKLGAERERAGRGRRGLASWVRAGSSSAAWSAAGGACGRGGLVGGEWKVAAIG